MQQLKVELQDFFGSDRAIAEAAWTSSFDYEKKKTRSNEDVERVVKMLAEHRHSTPFESVVFRFWIKMPIAIDRQFMTHRIQSANGLSGRYRTMPSEFQKVPEDVYNIFLKVYGDHNLAAKHEVEYEELCREANNWYKNEVTFFREQEKDGAITNNEFKRVREFLRGVLPQHNMTERVSIMNLRAFSNFQKLRNSEHAQPEIKQVAQLMLDEVKKSNVAPIAIEWLEKNNWNI